MFFPVRNALIYALVSAITGFATGFAKANVLDEMPNTQACRTLKNDIMPHVESRQNRDDLDFLMVGTYRQGKDGEQCRIFKGDRDRIKNSRDLNLSGISLYARERVFAWGRSCLLDWCDAAPGTPQSQVPSSTPPEPSSISCPGSFPNTWTIRRI